MSPLDSPRPLNLAYLPVDILRYIFENFTDAAYRKCRMEYHKLGPNTTTDATFRYPWQGPKTDRDSDDFKTVQALRLVCRSFCIVASTLLAPVLRVRVGPESLDRVDKITHNALIAAGVRVIQVSTAYRPKELNEPSAYRRRQNTAIWFVESSWTWQPGAETDPIMPPNEREKLDIEMRRAKGIYRSMLSAWRTWPENKHGRHRKILSQSFDEYVQLQQQQEQLLADGSFATTLAASISRLPSFQALAFVDEADISSDDFHQEPKDFTVLANDPSKLRQLLTAAQCWADLEYLLDPPDIPAFQLLWQLPIAIHSHGTRIPAISIPRIPAHSNFSHLCPPSNRGGWPALAIAFSGLHSIHLSVDNECGFRSRHPRPKDQYRVSSYVSALLSSPNLENIDISFHGLTLNAPDWGHSPKGFNPIGSAFAEFCAPVLTQLVLGYATFTQEELERVFQGLGTKLRRVEFMSVGVSGGGGWACPLEILRAKVTASSRECEVDFAELCGGGFEKLDSDESDDDMVYRAAERYVQGKEEVNPLVALEGEKMGDT